MRYRTVLSGKILFHDGIGMRLVLLLPALMLAACVVRPEVTSEPVIPKQSDSAVGSAESERFDPRSIARAYEHGYGVSKDMAKAVFWYEVAADEGNAAAALELGYLYYTGDHVPRNDEKALMNFTRAAQAGSPHAHLWLGGMALDGAGQPVDYEKALYHFRIAAESGDTLAMFELGHMYSRGRGVRRDLAKALLYYRDAAQGCDSLGVLFVGALYWKGLRDPRAALEWWEADEKEGMRTSAGELADLYLSGALAEDGAEMKALGWYMVGVARGDFELAGARSELEARLSDAEVHTATTWAWAFLSDHPGPRLHSGNCGQ